MPADIRSFFGGKPSATPAEPPPAKPTKNGRGNGRGNGRKVIDDDEDEDEPPKPAAKTPAKKKAKDSETVKGTEVTADAYFASSSKGKKGSSTNATPVKSGVSKDVPVRQSPRVKQESPAAAKTNGKATPKTKKPVTSHKKVDYHEDEDAYMDDDDDDAGDDIFAADVNRRKRKNDDYEEDESEEDDFEPAPKRAVTKGKKAKEEDTEDEKDVKPPKPKSKTNGKATIAKKRKSPADDEDDESEEEKPKKKRAPVKPRAKAAPKEETAEFKALLDAVPTVRAPTPPPKDDSKPFDWRQKAAGGGNATAEPIGEPAEIPEGAEGCLTGMAFVFTGLLKTIARETAQELVKRYGGKVTGAPSKNTTFVVLGDDAGPSKLRKIQELNIKTIDENGLFALIKSAPAHGGTALGAEAARKKVEIETKKIEEAAAKMDKDEKAAQKQAEKDNKAAIDRGAISATRPMASVDDQLWTTKYAPTAMKDICGNKTSVEKIQNWLKNWQKSRKYDFQKRGADGTGGARALILSGPPGIGKTTAAHLAAKLEGYDVLEANASDARSKKLVENGVSDVMNNNSLLGYFAGDGKKVENNKKNIVLVMDEVDGMSAGDRGGVGALAKLCKKTDVPMILICNERKLPKMKPFDFVTMDVFFRRPTVDQVRSRIMSIAYKEGLKLPPAAIDALIEGSNKDIRQIINMIASIKLDQKVMDFNNSKDMAKSWEKHTVLKPWDICQKMLAGGLFASTSKATLNDKIELYFNDHQFSFLMIQENYLRTKPSALTNKGYNRKEENLKHLELVDNAASSISDGDLVDRVIHGSQQQWSLMPTHAVFSSVLPSSYMAGQLLGSSFTSWLGNNSKRQKLERYVREIQSHMRLKTAADHNEIRQEYLPVFWVELIKRLHDQGKESVGEVIELMDSYYLTRDDFDYIKELGVGPQDESLINIESQTKATFTRMYNTMSHPVPFMKASNVVAPARKGGEKPDLEEAMDEDDDAEVLEPAEPAADDEDIDFKKDKYIKQPKAKPAKKAAAKKTVKKGVDDEEEDTKSPSKAKGRGKTATGGKGKK